MQRKNIFRLLDENYDIQSEIIKINDLFENDMYFSNSFNSFSLKELVEEYLFDDWSLRDTCISIREFLKRANATISTKLQNSEEKIINNLEVLENFIKLYRNNAAGLGIKCGIKYHKSFDTVFCALIETLEKRMGFTKRELDDRILLYPENAALEHVLDICEEVDVQWELIRYSRENMPLNEKRKSLAYLATNLYIEKDEKEQKTNIGKYANKATNILNNLHIRHNNKTGKWENAVLGDTDESDAMKLCDYVFSLMLTIVLLREQKNYEEVYNIFNKKQKDSKNKS